VGKKPFFLGNCYWTKLTGSAGSTRISVKKLELEHQVDPRPIRRGGRKYFIPKLGQDMYRGWRSDTCVQVDGVVARDDVMDSIGRGMP